MKEQYDKRIHRTLTHLERPIDLERTPMAPFVWMNENGFTIADGNPFELFHNDSREHPKIRSLVDFHIPILQRMYKLYQYSKPCGRT